MLAISGFGIFLIFLVFLFIVASIASKAQKQENQRHAQAMRDAMRAHMAQDRQEESAMDEEATPPPIPARHRRPAASRPQTRRPRAASPAAAPKQAAVPKPTAAHMPVSADSAPAIRKPGARVTAGQLRQQFILMELFSPPVALRDDSALSSGHGPV